MIRAIGVIGATGMLGRPVTSELVRAGYHATAIARHPERGPGFGGAASRSADVFDLASLRAATKGLDALYISLSPRPDQRPEDPHPEREGLRNVIEAARDNGIRRIGFLSSMVKDYESETFRWWAFEVKRNAVRLVRECGIPSIVFYASSFMENFTHGQRDGTRIMTAGESKHRQWYIDGHDFGRQVARAFALPGDDSREYFAQGPEAWTGDEAARIFVENYGAERLEVVNEPLDNIRALGHSNQAMANLAMIVEALNEYEETFRARSTWDELGVPAMTLAEFARRAGADDVP